MPDDRDDACPPDAENNTPDAPAPRPAPLQHDKADLGCLIALGGFFVLIFFLPAAAFLGGAPFIIPVIAILLLGLATPWLNPAERMAPAAKWWGRAITFVVIAALVVAAWLVLRHYFADRFVDETQPG
jgi:hypothetical protein